MTAPSTVPAYEAPLGGAEPLSKADLHASGRAPHRGGARYRRPVRIDAEVVANADRAPRARAAAPGQVAGALKAIGGVRAGATDGLGFLGVGIDAGRNVDRDGDRDVTAPGARVRTLVVAAREDLEIARQVHGLLLSSSPRDGTAVSTDGKRTAPCDADTSQTRRGE